MNDDRAYPYQPDNCPHGSWARNGVTWTCQLCGLERETREIPKHLRNVPCIYCGSPGLDAPTHIYGERKCCPDCEHRPTETQPLRDALIEVLAARGLGPESRLIAAELLPVVQAAAADAVHKVATELRDVALTADRHGESQMWNGHRVWTWLRDRADLLAASQ